MKDENEAEAATQRTVIIAADRIVPSPQEGVLCNGVVVVNGGRIENVGAASDFGLPDIDLGDCTLMAGMIDAHVHMFKSPGRKELLPHQQSVEKQLMQVISNAQRFLRVGVTSVRDMGGPGNLVGTVRDAIAGKTLSGCRIQTSNEVITITGGHGSSFGMECDDILSIRRAVRSHVKINSDWIKIMASGGFSNPYHSEREAPFTPLFSTEEMNAIVAEAHRFGLPATAHCQARDSIAMAFEAGVDTLEHVSFADKPYAIVDQDLARAIADKSVPVVPTTNNYWLNQGVPWAPKDIAMANLKILHDCGVLLAAGTDMGLPTTTPETYADGLEVMAVAGIPLTDVFAAATTAAAAAVGKASELGQIKAGYLADLVALDGDPLADVRSYRQVRWVMVDGEAVSNRSYEAHSSPPPPQAEWSGVHLFGD